MGTLGTFFTIGALAAVGAVAYGIYNNSDKIGGALSRGVEKTITNPLGKYVDSLFTNATDSAVSAVQNAVTQPIQQQVTNASNALDAALNTATGVVQGIANPLPVANAQPSKGYTETVVPVDQVATPSQAVAKYGFKSGYYYLDYKGSKYDRQVKFTDKSQLNRYQKLAGQGYFNQASYIGKSKLGASGLNLFAQSKNYL